jgi:hypothetical protein
MKLLPPIATLSAAVLPAAVLAAGALSGCNANPDTNVHDHWNFRGIAPSFQRAALGYDAEKNGRYVDYQYENKKSIYLTLKRHGLNQNPENPFQEEDEAFYAPRPVSSILPRPWEYINFEGIAWGAIIAGATGGIFVPVPIDSVIGTMSDGGGDEFKEGIRQTFSGGNSTTSASFLHEAVGMEVKAVPAH